MRCLFLSVWVATFFVTSANAFRYDQNGLFGMEYGPNLSWTTFGNTPFVFGQWLPQGVSSVRLNWLEPLDELNYHDKLNGKSTFLRMTAALDVSPFYENLTFGLGIRPFPINPGIELQVAYKNLVYFNSNVEMSITSVKENDAEYSTAKMWKSSYVLEHLWDNDILPFNYMQTFVFSGLIEYLIGADFLIGAYVGFELIDIETPFDGKSYDYQRNMPVFSRDYILELSVYTHIPIHKNLAIIAELDANRSGRSKKNNVVKKESLAFMKGLAGVVYSLKEGEHRLTLAPGFFVRSEDRFYNGSVAQQFLIQFEYQWNFGFGSRER